MGKPSPRNTRHASGKAAGLFGKVSGELFRLSKSQKRGFRLDARKIDSETRRSWRKKRPSHKPTGPTDTMKSRRIDPDGKNLSPSDRRMVDAVREARRDAGAKDKTNFASIRYVGNDGKERILAVGSDGVHSERIGASYLLERGIAPSSIRGVYTERSPCDTNPSYCDPWMKEHLPHVDVSHSFPYDKPNRVQGNRDHWKWVQSLF